ncbi:hypothetical protein ACIGN6_20630 [Streptomyces sp. NPDC053792]|uniref:hypothetical protein n=1 Tax=Streptomyces sp. NPDC053792 TaxID=3365716 RepID=UPI0037CE543E
MRPQNPSPLECRPTATRPAGAEQPVALRAVGARKVVAEGVPSGCDPHPVDGPRILAMLHIGAAGRNAMPTAHSWCSCGRDLKAFGHKQVARLADDHARHRNQCPLLAQGKEAA